MVCEDGSTAEWNIDSWGLVNITPNGAKKIKCNIDFKNGTNLIEYLRNLNSSELVEDDYGNLRYIGANPNNYVSFNNELWRIIGVMKDIENPDGSKEDKVKLIRKESIGNYSWDYKANEVGSSKNNNGSNNWSDSQLMMMLNPSDRILANYTIDNDGYVLDQNGIKIFKNPGSYWNRTTGYKPASATTNSFTENSVNFSNIGLIEEARNMISSSVWNLGGLEDYISKNNGLVKHWYIAERGTKVSSGGSINWTGNVGLMYPSDYGYATAGGSTEDRNTCLNTILYKWNESSCKENNWLLSSGTKWTLTPFTGLGNGYIFNLANGEIKSTSTNADFYIYPVIYMNPEIELQSLSEGSITSPFTLKV